MKSVLYLFCGYFFGAPGVFSECVSAIFLGLLLIPVVDEPVERSQKPGERAGKSE
jgi:hypothetical protein